MKKIKHRNDTHTQTKKRSDFVNCKRSKLLITSNNDIKLITILDFEEGKEKHTISTLHVIKKSIETFFREPIWSIIKARQKKKGYKKAKR